MGMKDYLPSFLGGSTEQAAPASELGASNEEQELLGNQEVQARMEGDGGSGDAAGGAPPTGGGGSPADGAAPQRGDIYVYTCSGDETYSELAGKAGADWKVIQEMNPDQDPRKLAKGTELRLPLTWAAPLSGLPEGTFDTNPDVATLQQQVSSGDPDARVCGILFDRLSPEDKIALQREDPDTWEALQGVLHPGEGGFAPGQWVVDTASEGMDAVTGYGTALADSARNAGASLRETWDEWTTPWWSSETTEEVAVGEKELDEANYESPTEQLSREEFMDDYEAWLLERLDEAYDLEGDARVERVEGLLAQVQDVSVRFNAGELTDISKLPTTPRASKRLQGDSFVPPELIDVVRKLIVCVEAPVEGATSDEAAPAEADAHGSGIDWNATLGVPQYRAQQDNLVASSVTCNVTSGAMAFERIGYSREDVLEAVKRELKTSWMITKKAEYEAEHGQPMDEGMLAELEGSTPPDEFIVDKVDEYFTRTNREGRDRSVRSGRDKDLVGSEGADARRAVATDYLAGAQMEDLLDFLMQTHYENGGFAKLGKGADMGQVRRSIGDVGTELLGLIDPTAENSRSRSEVLLRPWADAKLRLKEHLENGGSAQIQIDQKGTTKNGGHYISAQRVVADGVIVDDPWGAISDDYRKESTAGDGFSIEGGRKNDVDTDIAGQVGADWTWQEGQVLREEEQKGRSVKYEDVQMEGMFWSATLYSRATKGETET